MRYPYGYYYQRQYWQMESEFIRMYPPVYHQVYPVISGVIDEMDDPWKYPVPPQRMVDEMWAQCMQRMENMEFGENLEAGEEAAAGEGVESKQYFGGRFFRPLIGVILVSELLRRRRRFFY